MTRKARREDKQERKHPHKPPRPPTGTTAAPASPPPPPSVGGGSYIVRIYDYTDRHSPYAQIIADYYASWLTEADSRVSVQYLRMEPLDLATCSQTHPPQPGIRLCEDHTNPSPGIVASSNGMWWTQTGPSTWELSSEDYFFLPDPESVMTCRDCDPVTTNTAGEYALCHEIGHSFGLGHRNDPGQVPVDATHPPSCLGGGGYSPGTLTNEEKALILSKLPAPGTTSAMGVRSRNRANVCELPPPTHDGTERPLHRHHQHH